LGKAAYKVQIIYYDDQSSPQISAESCRGTDMREDGLGAFDAPLML